MRPFSVVKGSILPLDRSDVDTDQIMPKQFLTRLERSGYGEFVFFEWRKNPEFPMNLPQYGGSSILVAGRNFGSGSSREHAAWGLQDYGFNVIVAPSFADIFKSNCRQVGLLAAVASEGEVSQLIKRAQQHPEEIFTVDLLAQTIYSGTMRVSFEIDSIDKDMLLRGLDDVEIMASKAHEITLFERRRPAWKAIAKR